MNMGNPLTETVAPPPYPDCNQPATNAGYDQAMVTPANNHTVVVVQQPAPVVVRVLPGPWNDGIFSCFEDVASCCFGLFLPVCHACNVASRMDESCCVGMLNIPAMRTKMRMKHNINGSICNDIVISACCTPCVVCQMDREQQFRAQ